MCTCVYDRSVWHEKEMQKLIQVRERAEVMRVCEDRVCVRVYMIGVCGMRRRCRSLFESGRKLR